ncbi:uncharacterized protein LOC130380392 isoform X2 [Gadus chalcogrammus]|uniref:uncharacterized protein LOC130380392 isoform X2 n=1 Tax=Gadus chalcogrammus TaxID=1042646 RepID=UPI0024C29E4D|nr:uncharacterized protein LOC130380392 isoform X2 [Gadus chalcogrammus]
MKLSCALLLLTSAVLGVRPSSAQQYFEVGTTLTLEPDVSAVKKPIDTIRWKYGTALVVDWDPSGHPYYGSFKGRTTLDPQTLRLVINHLTLADSGQFSVETNLGRVGTHEVKVIKPPPKPLVNTTKNSEGAHALRCTADTKDLGPVSYEWKKDELKEGNWEEGPWTKGEELKGMNSSDTPEKFSCRLTTRVRPGEASDPVRNPTELPPKPRVMTTKNSAGVYTLKCTADTQDLGPVSYEWKEYGRKEGNWTKGDQLMVMSPKTCEEFSCRLITLLRTSEASDPVPNPLCEPPGSIWWKVLLGITVPLVACAALITVVYKCPEHPISKRLKKWIPGNKDGASEGPNDKMDTAGGHV